MMRTRLFSVIGIILMLTSTGCSSEGSPSEKERQEAENMVYDAYMAKDYQRIMLLADSLQDAGLFSEGKACYWLGYACDRMMQKRMAELYWKTGLTTVENSTDAEDVRVYAGIANRLTGLKCTWGEYEAAMKVAIPAVERLEHLKCDTTPEYTNMLIYIGCYQSRFGLSEQNADESLEKSYRAHLDNIGRHPGAFAYRDAIVGVINICYNFLEIHNYEKALFWTDRFHTLLTEYVKQADAKPDYADKQWARYYVYRASALGGLDRKDEADEAYDTFLRTAFSKTAEGKILAADYLGVAGQWQKAADNYSYTDAGMASYNVDLSLESVQKFLLRKFNANMKAGRRDTAQAVSMFIAEHLDSAITKTRLADAREEEFVHQKELEMSAENERMLRQRQLGRLIGMAALIVALMVYIIVRHRHQARLAKAHHELKAAYDQLEETTTIKERMESELRIATGIQMSMLPSTFPEVEGLDMYASMTPAREVGGDLYNYLVLGDKLYFCIGDVSGKGVPASLFMTLATRGFRTLALQGASPAAIATRMNAELSEDNQQGMFVTMFICRLDMTLGRLEYCNAGHNPPIIGNADGQFSFLDVEANAPIGLWPGLEYVGEEIDFFRDRLLLLYTDGLNEAENPRQEQYGDDRILQQMSTLSAASAADIIETLKADVGRFRNGAEPNDDLTMLAFRYA